MPKTLLDLALEVPDDLIYGHYIESDNSKCAVGWMLEQAGLSDKEIRDLDTLNSDAHIFQKVGEIYGLTEEQVESIVSANDSIEDEYDDETGLNPSQAERQLVVRRALLKLTGAIERVEQRKYTEVA